MKLLFPHDTNRYVAPSGHVFKAEDGNPATVPDGELDLIAAMKRVGFVEKVEEVVAEEVVVEHHKGKKEVPVKVDPADKDHDPDPTDTGKTE